MYINLQHRMYPKEIFLEIVKSDEYPATVADGPAFANKGSGDRGS